MNLTWYTACPECGSAMPVERQKVNALRGTHEALVGQHCGWVHVLQPTTPTYPRPEYVPLGKTDPNP